jgi:hypothetical protein
MSLPWKPIVLSSAGVLLLAGALAVMTPSPAEAQCGSQASSCKNCHEVQAQDVVNTKGDWHISHAFGDFCEFCHAGNVQAMEAEAAHEGMVDPLADPQASCSACHPTDAHDLAVVYGTALGVDVGSAPPVAPAASPTPAPMEAASGPAAPPSADIIDFNAQYAQTVEGQQPGRVGNWILGILIAGLVLAGGGYVLWNERRRRAPAIERDETQPPAMPAPAPTSDPGALLAAIAALDPLGRRGLEHLLRDPKAASLLLHRLSRLDPDLIRSLRSLDRETRALLLALTSE